MPIEVRELVIRATVEPPPAAAPAPAPKGGKGDAAARRAAAIVLEALRRQAER